MMKKKKTAIPRRGKRFATMRRKIGLTQATIAQWFGTTTGTLNRWENEKTPLDRSAAILLWLLYDEQVNHNRNALRDFVKARV